jgi:mannose-6-phosphate isomerase-like protein (cupin superfamily)
VGLDREDGAKPEPPPHVHEWEHELYFVPEGTMRFYGEDRCLDIGRGEIVLVPQRKAHAFTCTSDVVRTLTLVQSAGRPGYLMRLMIPSGSLLRHRR